MQNTTNYGLKKPESVDYININDFNENADIIDTQLKENADGLTSHKNETATQLVQQATEINRLRKVNNEQNKEIAYLKLKQEASDRIEGGTTFADGMNGNSFGIEFDSELSENVVFKDGALTLNEGVMVESNVDDSVVISGSYTTLGNGGRKLVRLDNGTLVCVFTTNTSWYVYKSIDNGVSWESCYSGTQRVHDISLATDGKYVYLLYCYNYSVVTWRTFNENVIHLYAKDILKDLKSAEACSLAINEEGTELHACWASKNSIYSSSTNIQYCRGVISEDGSVTWGSVKQLTTFNSASYYVQYPSIVLNANNQPVILHHYYYSSSSRRIGVYYYDGSSWKYSDVYDGGSHVQEYPSAIFVPKSVNGLENGRIWVAWHGRDSTDNSRDNLRVSYSDDNGVTWSPMKKLTSGNSYYQFLPSITANKDDEVFITWHGYTSGKTIIRQIKWKGGVWGEIEGIKQIDSKDLINPSTLYGTKWNVDFTKPLFVYTIGSTSINFTGSWQVGSYKPTTEATAVYKLPSTDYVGMFVQKEGNVNIEATVNDIPMDSLLENNEYQFTKALDNETPVTLKLSLSRENTTNGDNDKITRMLGGRS